MSFLLDTCLISELIKRKPQPSVVTWMKGIEEQELFLSVLTLGELQKGIAKLPSGRKAASINKGCN